MKIYTCSISMLEGCERSSFPCELSTFGCCPNGETAALTKDGAGCGENCLTTKFGCCPDGKTAAKGAENEGNTETNLIITDPRLS